LPVFLKQPEEKNGTFEGFQFFWKPNNLGLKTITTAMIVSMPVTVTVTKGMQSLQFATRRTEAYFPAINYQLLAIRDMK